MPPKAKCTKEEITDAAFRIVRESGISALSARSLARALKISTAPIFTMFDTIEEIQNEVIKRAKALYAEYINEGLNQKSAFKGAGIKYIQFAKDEPELFKLIFISGGKEGKPTHFLPEYDDNAPMILETVKNNYGMNTEKAKRIYNHMSVYALGFASLFSQHIYLFTMDDISNMMSEVFTALIKNEREEDINA